MTENEFKELGTMQHHKLKATWNGKKWRLTQTVQVTGTVYLQKINARRRNPITTGYKYVELLKE